MEPVVFLIVGLVLLALLLWSCWRALNNLIIWSASRNSRRTYVGLMQKMHEEGNHEAVLQLAGALHESELATANLLSASSGAEQRRLMEARAEQVAARLQATSNEQHAVTNDEPHVVTPTNAEGRINPGAAEYFPTFQAALARHRALRAEGCQSVITHQATGETRLDLKFLAEKILGKPVAGLE